MKHDHSPGHQHHDHSKCKMGHKHKTTEATNSKPVAGAEYTCPMHPEIRQIGPGDCPICGMALEPVTVALDQPEDNSEFLDMKKRLWVSGVLTLPIFIIAMGGRHLLPAGELQQLLTGADV